MHRCRIVLLLLHTLIACHHTLRVDDLCRKRALSLAGSIGREFRFALVHCTRKTTTTTISVRGARLYQAVFNDDDDDNYYYYYYYYYHNIPTTTRFKLSL
jgi:hypothetical protein